MSFNSNENKAFLWTLLQKHKMFDGFQNNMFPSIHSEFEQYINSYNDNPQFQTMELIDKNRQFLLFFKDFLSSYQNKNLIDNEIKLSEKTKSEKLQQNVFETRLREKEREFNNLINSPAPQKIDFSDEKQEVSNDLNVSQSRNYDKDQTNDNNLISRIAKIEETLSEQQEMIILLKKDLEKYRNESTQLTSVSSSSN